MKKFWMVDSVYGSTGSPFMPFGYERNQPNTVRPESFGYAQESLVEGLILSFIKN